MLLRMIFVVGALVLANNLYSVADAETRASLRLPLTALSSAHRDTATRVAGIVRELESACRDTVPA